MFVSQHRSCLQRRLQRRYLFICSSKTVCKGLKNSQISDGSVVNFSGSHKVGQSQYAIFDGMGRQLSNETIPYMILALARSRHVIEVLVGYVR